MNIAIIGLGVIGGSFALALKEAGYREVYGVDRDPETLQTALRRGMVLGAETEAARILPHADLTILALYPGAVLPFLQENAKHFRPGSLVTDATGVKTRLASGLAGILPADVDFVLGHPMAGREKRGIDFASAEVFRGANYILTPLPSNSEEHLRTLEALVRELGFAGVRRVSPQFHDEIIAFTSQLPHAMAVALINSDREGRDTGRFIGDSYRDLTRIAKINSALWSELFLENRENLLGAIDGFCRELEKIRSAIAAGDREALVGLFEISRARREALEESRAQK